MAEEVISGVNWTVVFGILAAVVPICLTFIGVWLKHFSSPSEVKRLKEDFDKSNKELLTKLSELTKELEAFEKDFDEKLNNFRESIERKHFGDHDELSEKINKAKEELAKLHADIRVLQTNQDNSDKSFVEMREDYKNLVKRFETIVDKMIEYMANTD
jgi:chromosome segregation ATPase